MCCFTRHSWRVNELGFSPFMPLTGAEVLLTLFLLPEGSEYEPLISNPIKSLQKIV